MQNPELRGTQQSHLAFVGNSGVSMYTHLLLKKRSGSV